MHIAHVLTRFLRAGSEENTIATCLWQAKNGHRVTLIHGRDFDPSWHDVLLPGVALELVQDLVHHLDHELHFGLDDLFDEGRVG